MNKLAVVVVVLGLAGCANQTGTDALIGGGAGAGAGWLLGGPTGGIAGGLLGGAAGAAVGEITKDGDHKHHHHERE